MLPTKKQKCEMLLRAKAAILGPLLLVFVEAVVLASPLQGDDVGLGTHRYSSYRWG